MKQKTFPSSLLLDNPLVEEIIQPKSYDDKFYNALLSRINRISIIADALYSYRKNKTNATEKECELVGFLFESLVFQMRIVYDNLYFVVKKEVGFKNYKQIKKGSFNNFLEKIRKDKDLLRVVHSELGKKGDDIIRSKKFSELRDIRNSIKMKATFIRVMLKRKRMYIEEEYCFEDVKGKRIIKGYIDNIVYDYCSNLSKWMFILQKLLDDGYVASLKKYTKKIIIALN